ncbi:MAG: tetratricopeptide repeat protein [Parachlamydia sp.]|nr:tetratricopeptide repeat protein [Parachlamydia sp.]
MQPAGSSRLPIYLPNDTVSPHPTKTATVPTSHHNPTIDKEPTTSLQNIASMTWTWKNRGEFHLGRKELDLAIDAFTNALQEAEKKGNVELMGECLNDLGRIFLEKEQWTLGAKIFNSAYALSQKSCDGKSRQTTLALMAEVERRFLKKEFCILTSVNPRVYLDQRQSFQILRQEMHSKIENDIPTQTILLEFSQGISRFLEKVLNSGFSIFGKPPCDYTVISLGSLARKEMSPFSDLEFALLIDKSSPDILYYFRKMVQWLEIQVINLGETEIKILDRGHESLVLRGFSFDDGGNTPLGKQGFVELIKTPEELAQFQSERFYEEDLILSNTLCNADILMGSETLYARYIKSVKAILSTKSAQTSLSFSQARALNLLQGHLVEFEPRLDKKKEGITVININRELYRLPNFLVAGLANYLGISEQNSWKRLEALVKANVLCPEGAKHLAETMAAIMRLRIRCHLYYGEAREDVRVFTSDGTKHLEDTKGAAMPVRICFPHAFFGEQEVPFYPSKQQKGAENIQQNEFALSDTDINQIIEIYRVILPLYRSVKQFCQTGNLTELSKELFYGNSLLIEGEVHENFHRYTQARNYYEQAVAINPNDATAFLNLADLLSRLEEHGEAKDYADKALELGKRKNDETIVSKALKLQGVFLNNLGNQWKVSGDAKKAILCFEEALEINISVYGKDHSEIAICCKNLGDAWLNLVDPKRALGYYEEALRICKKNNGDQHPEVATYLTNLGYAWQVSGDATKANNCYQEALSINKKVFDGEHSVAAIKLN